MKVFKSAPNSLHMLLFLMMVVVLLNISNSLFYFLVDVPFRPKFYFSDNGENFEIDNLSGSQSDELLWIHGLFSNNVTKNKSKSTTEKSYKKGYLCPEVPEGLGPVSEDSYIMSLKALRNMYFEVNTGGLYVPECDSLQSVAILVIFRGSDPGRGRESRVGAFLYYMHPFLMKQKIEYQIFVLEQSTQNPTFYKMSIFYNKDCGIVQCYADTCNGLPYKIPNAGALLNVGYYEVMKLRPEGWSCIIFQDIDLYPCDTRNLYRCSDNPKQMISTCDSRFTKENLYGVVAVTPEQFESTGGFSMVLWGTTKPDYYDLYRKFLNAGYQIERSDDKISGYTNFEERRRTTIENQSDYEPYIKSDMIHGPPHLRFQVAGIERHRLFIAIHIDVEYPVPIDDSNYTEQSNDSYNNILQQ